MIYTLHLFQHVEGKHVWLGVDENLGECIFHSKEEAQAEADFLNQQITNDSHHYEPSL